MSGVRFAATIDSITSGTATLTLLQLVAAANQRVKVERIRVSGKGTSNSDAPVLFEVLKQSTAGTASGLTPVKLNDADDETLQVTAQKTFTAEPTPGNVKASFHVHPQVNGEIVFPPGRELWIKGGERLGIRVNTPTQVTTFGVHVEGEE